MQLKVYLRPEPAACRLTVVEEVGWLTHQAASWVGKEEPYGNPTALSGQSSEALAGDLKGVWLWELEFPVVYSPRDACPSTFLASAPTSEGSPAASQPVCNLAPLADTTQ